MAEDEFSDALIQELYIQFKQILERGEDNKIIPCYLYPGIVWKYFLLKRFQVSLWVLGDHVHLEDPFFLAFQCNLGDPDVLGAHHDLAALELLKGNFELIHLSFENGKSSAAP